MVLINILYCIFYALSLGFLFYFTRRHRKTDKEVYGRRIVTELVSFGLISQVIVNITLAQVLGKINIWADGDFSELLMFEILILLIGYWFIKKYTRFFNNIYVYKNTKRMEVFSLYLRPFDSDASRNEKKLTTIISKYWSCFAIGNPNTFSSSLLSNRIYLTDENWQKCVDELMGKASMIMLRVGNTDGAKWEISKSFKDNYINKTVYLVYSKEDFDYLDKELKDSNYPPLPSLDWEYKGAQYGFLLLGDEWLVADLRSKSSFKYLIDCHVENDLDAEINLQRNLNGTYKNYFNNKILSNSLLKHVRIRVFSMMAFAIFLILILGYMGLRIWHGNDMAIRETSLGGIELYSVNGNLQPIKIDSKSINWANNGSWINKGIVPTVRHSTDIDDSEAAEADNVTTDICGITEIEVSGDSIIIKNANEPNSENKIIEHEFYKYGFIDYLYPADHHLIYNTSDGFVIIQDLNSSAVLKIFEPVYKIDGSYLVDEMSGIALNHKNNAVLITRVADSNINIFNLKTGDTRQIKTISDGERIISQNDSETLVAISESGSVRKRKKYTIEVFDFDSGKKIANLYGHLSSVVSIAFSPDNSKLLSLSEDNTARVWDISSQKELYRIQLPQFYYTDKTIGIFSSDGKYIGLSSSGDINDMDAVFQLDTTK